MTIRIRPTLNEEEANQVSQALWDSAIMLETEAINLKLNNDLYGVEYPEPEAVEMSEGRWNRAQELKALANRLQDLLSAQF